MGLGKAINKNEFENIKLLASHGLKTTLIAQVTGRGKSTIDRIKQAEDWNDWQKVKDKAHYGAEAVRLEPEAVKEPESVQTHLLDDNLLMRIADGIDYNNALMNGLVAKLDLICKALGV